MCIFYGESQNSTIWTNFYVSNLNLKNITIFMMNEIEINNPNFIFLDRPFNIIKISYFKMKYIESFFVRVGDGLLGIKMANFVYLENFIFENCVILGSDFFCIYF